MEKEKNSKQDSSEMENKIDKRDRSYRNRKTRDSRKSKSYRNSKREDGFNDAAWYFKYPALSEAASKVGFNHITGTGYINGLDGSQIIGGTIPEPTILSLQYLTTPGTCRDETSGYSLQIRQLYLAMKRKYRGLNTYQPGDLGVTLFCIMEFYRYVAKLERIYGICKYYSAHNRTFPLGLGTALRFKYDSVVNNLADFRLGINTLITRAASLCLPNGIDILNRWFLLESNVFKDAESNRASYLLFDDANVFYTYQPSVYQTGGAAVATHIGAHWTTPDSGTYQELLESGSDMLSILLEDDDVTLQLGDIISYFTKPDGSTELLKLEWIPEDYVVIPTYNEDILMQIHNSTTGSKRASTVWPFAYLYDSTQFNAGSHSYFDLGFNIDNNHPIALAQINGVCRYELGFGYSVITRTVDAADIPVFDFNSTSARTAYQCKSGNTFLNSWKDNPDSKDVMEMTRLKVGVVDKCEIFDTAAGTYAHFCLAEALGSEVIMGYTLIAYNPATHAPSLTYLNTVNTTGLSALGTQLSQFAAFDWHPCAIIAGAPSGNTAPTSVTISSVWFDFDNARPIDVDTLRIMHDAAILSLFKVESIAAFDQSAKVLD